MATIEEAKVGGGGAALYLVLVASILLAYAQPILALATDGWLHTNALSHGYLLLIVSAVEMTRRLRYARWPSRPTTPWPLLSLGALSALWLAAHQLGIETLTQGLVPMILASATLAYGGRAQLPLVMPWMLMLFAVPGWSLLGPFLQSMAIVVVTNVTRVAGIPAHIEGEFFELPYGTLQIADGCSGVHQFTIGVLLSVLLCISARQRPRQAVWVILAGAVVTLIANWIRISILVWVAYESEMQHRWIAVDHFWMGWTVFALVFGAFIFSASRYLETHPAGDTVEAAPQAAPAETPTGMRLRALRALLVAAIGPVTAALL